MQPELGDVVDIFLKYLLLLYSTSIYYRVAMTNTTLENITAKIELSFN